MEDALAHSVVMHEQTSPDIGTAYSSSISDLGNAACAAPCACAEHAEHAGCEDHATIPFVAAPTAAQIVEALLFASDAPLSAARLADLVGDVTAGEVEHIMEELNARYAAMGATFRIQPIARGFQLMTLADFAPWLCKLDKQRSQTRLTGATLEVLAVVAYKQPIMRADIESVRGVACGEVLNRLREMGLVKIVGRAEIVGRPLLYGTTRKFLDVFGLSDLEELPPMEALTLRKPAAPAPESQPSLRAAAGA